MTGAVSLGHSAPVIGVRIEPRNDLEKTKTPPVPIIICFKHLKLAPYLDHIRHDQTKSMVVSAWAWTPPGWFEHV